MASLLAAAADQIGDGVLDSGQARIDARVVDPALQRGDGLFQPRHGAAGLGFAFADAGVQPLDRLAQLRQRQRGAVILLHRADAFVHGEQVILECLGGAFGFVAGHGLPSGQRFHVLRQRRNLRGGLVGGFGDLIGETRQARMQALHRVLQSVIGGVTLDMAEPFRQRHHMAVELVEGLGLFARRDIDFGGGLAHGAIVLGLAAFGGIEPAGDALQMLFNPLCGRLGFVFAAGNAGQHVFGIAGCGGSAFGHGAVCGRTRGCGVAPGFGGAVDPVGGFGHGAQNLARQPFSD